jgi:hypothetical protein
VTSEFSEFLIRCLRATSFDNCDDLWWRTDGAYAPVALFINCNDVFWWGTGDCERITPENIGVLEQSYVDAKAACDIGSAYGGTLFCARVRKIRPQGAAYPDEPSLWPLFDACGPERAVGMGNPKPHPADVVGAER